MKQILKVDFYRTWEEGLKDVTAIVLLLCYDTFKEEKVELGTTQIVIKSSVNKLNTGMYSLCMSLKEVDLIQEINSNVIL